MDPLNSPSSERIESLDLLRGIALLGILAINIQSFGMPKAAYMNPTVWGSLDGIGGVLWAVSHLLLDQKMVTLFSMLFGAGVILFTERSPSPLKFHYRRNFWLLIFGLIHAYFLWYGDILVTYAICAFFIYPLRNLSLRKLFILSFLFLSIPSIFYLFTGLSLSYIPQEVIEQDFLPSWNPGSEMIAAEIAAYQGGWLEQLSQRAYTAFKMQTFLLIMWSFWRTMGTMLMGMALYRLGILTGKGNPGVYRSLLLSGLIIGLPVIGFGIYWNFQKGWSLQSMFIGSQFNYWASIIVSLGWIGVMFSIQHKDRWQWIITRLSAVGRMAFTNYIMHSLILGLIFYGHGLGLFSKVDRQGQALIVMGVWIFQLWLSPWWLKRYYYGPLEWLWRQLTYQRHIKLKRISS
jgi:uncharacterized protein